MTPAGARWPLADRAILAGGVAATLALIALVQAAHPAPAASGGAGAARRRWWRSRPC